MKKLIKPFAIICSLALTITSCKKQTKDFSEDGISETTISQIKSLGFGTQGVKKVQGGFLVEGDILLSEADLSSSPGSTPQMVIAQEEQYRTFNLVSVTKHPTIKVALNNSSAQHDPAFSAALDEAIRRYNAEGLQLSFTRVTTSQAPDITIVAFYENSSTLGSAGFPNSSGDPYNQVRMNTYHYSTSTGTTNVNYISTIISHEMGHCIGFRHTDYMARQYSCGGRRKVNEGTAGVGAILIPGTPSQPDAESWMLACSNGGNRLFNANDVIALNYLY